MIRLAGIVITLFLLLAGSPSFSAPGHYTVPGVFHSPKNGLLKQTETPVVARPMPFKENKKVVALLLTFFLGMLGAHRLYLGTKPWVPAAYLLTFGGGFLILPLIDFFVILFAKDLEPFINNDSFFMWLK